jgi:predicted nucleotidyltransferase
LTRSVKVLLNLERLEPAIRLPEWAEGIGIYGSWAEGTNIDESDIDLWILASRYPGDTESGNLRAAITGALGTEVHLLFLTREKLEALKTGDEPFYRSLMRTALLLRGTDLGHA